MLSTRGLEPGENPIEILGLSDVEDQPASEVVSRARFVMAERCGHWTPSIVGRWGEERLWEYRRWVHAYALLAADPVGVCDDVRHGNGVSRRLLAEVPYPETGEMDWAALFARDMFQLGEDTRADELQILPEATRAMVSACKPLGESTWGYRLKGIEPFELGEMLAGLLSLPEISINGLPAGDPTVYAVKWRWSKWEAHGCQVHATIKAVNPKERATWEAGPPPLFLLTINGPVWLLKTEHERMATLHHELSHAKVETTDKDADYDGVVGLKPSLRPHDAEVMGCTASRFGAMSITEAHLIEAAWRNPNTQYLLERARRESLPSPFDLERLNAPAPVVAELGGDVGDGPEVGEPTEESDPFAGI